MKEGSKRIKGFHSRIGLKLIIPYLISSFVILIVISNLIFYDYQSDIVSVKDTQKEIAVRSSAEIDFYLQNILRELILTKKNIACLDCKDEAWKNMLKVFMFGNPSVYTLSVMDDRGNEVHHISKYEETVGVDTRSKLQQEILQGVFSGHEEHLSDVYVSEYGLPSLSLGVPIKNAENKILGVILVAVDLSPLWNTVSKIQVGKTGYVYVVDEKGDLITYKDISLVKGSSGLRNVTSIKNLLDGNSDSLAYTSFTGEKVIGTLKPVQSVKWDVIVELPFKEVLARLYPLFILAIFSIIVFIFSTFYILHLIYRRLLLPLGLLKKGVVEIEGGNYGGTIGIVSPDELGDLAISFSEMSRNLKKSREELKKYNENLEEKVKERTLELTRANEHLRELDKEKSEFVSIASHQLRTPLTAISGYASMLLEGSYGKLSKQIKEAVDRIYQSSGRLVLIIEDFLDITKIEQGRMTYQFTTVDMKGLLRNLVEEMQPHAREKNMDISLIIDDQGSFNATADFGKIRQVMSNLIDNAIKYSMVGKITVNLTRNSSLGKIHISVQDTGIGISLQTMEKLFQKFSRAEGVKKIYTEGSGLGLYVAQEMVKAHHGRIWVESKGEGKGSTFHVELMAED